MRATRLWVLVFGGIGLALVARAGVFYRSSDSFAFGLVLLIAIGLASGLAELWLREARAHAFGRELDAMPRPGSAEALDKASPRLGAMLRARVSGVGMAATPSFTPYLLGLLVMVGMLGTFMGLFETLRGAREALTASGDVEALRSGLAAPMSGLTRAFGTSAAGVAASAMLGLAAVFVRRAEARFVNALGAYVTGPLADLSPAARQLAALERLAFQSDALPRAASSLEAVTERLASLEERVATLHREGHDHTKRAVAQATIDLTAELGRGLDAATAAVGASVGPLLERAVAKNAELTAESLAAWTARVEADAEERRRAEAESRERALLAEAATQARLDASAERLAGTLGAELTRMSEAEAARGEAMTAQIAALWPRLTAELGALGEGLSAPLAEVARAALAAPEAAARLVDEAARRLESREQADRAQSERIEALVLALSEHSQAFAAAGDAQVRALAETSERQARALLEAAAVAEQRSHAAAAAVEARSLALQAESHERSSAAITAALAKLAERDAARAEDVAARIGELWPRIGEELGALGERLSGPLADVARSAQEAPAAAARLVDEASQRLEERARADREQGRLIEALVASLSEHAEAFSRTTERQAEVLTTMMSAAEERSLAATTAAEQQSLALRAEAKERLADLEREAEARLQAIATETERRLLAATTLVESTLAQQAQAHARLERTLGEERALTVATLSAELRSHAERLGEGLAGSSALVREAAELVRGGGAELSAVAELFTAAVDSYREASESWKDSLTRLESAAERHAESEAVDLLASYVDQTREVFEHAIELQRELFNELRGLRGAKPAAAARAT